PPEADDEVVDRAAAGEGVVAPDAVHDLVAAHDLAGPLGEHAQDAELALGELYLAAVRQARRPGPEVDDVAAEREALGRRGLRALQQRPHPQQELVEVERLREVV